MLPRLLALAGPAAAFLVVPDMAPASHPDESEGAFKALPIDDISPFALPALAQSQTVNIPCAECTGEDAILKLDIKVQDHNRLLVNGFEVYPADDAPLGGGLTASVSSADGRSKVEDLMWVIWWQVTDVDKAQGMHILDFHLDVVGVGNVPVSAVDVGMSLVIGPNGEILIADIQNLDRATDVEAVRVCDGLWCSLEQAWDNLFKGGRGCHRHHEEMVANPPDFKMPEAVEGDMHHGHHLGKMVKNVAAHIFLPVVMGITAGVGAAVLVMFLCSIVAFVARKLAGRETPYSWTLVPTEVVVIEEVDDDDEKNSLMGGQAPPPAYEERTEKQ